MEFEFTAHARQRFVERVRPGLTDSQAKAQLQALARSGRVVQTPPDWCQSDHGRAACLLLGEDVCFPLERRRNGSYVALTCVVREVKPWVVRNRRAAKRKSRAYRRWRAQNPEAEAA